MVLFGSDHPSDFRPRFLLPLRISPSPTCLFSKKTLERKVMQLMRWSVICFNGEAPFSSRYGLPIVIRHSLTAPREALSLQILASLHLLLIVCLSGYLREKCTHLRKKKKKTDPVLNTAKKEGLSLSHCVSIMKTKRLFKRKLHGAMWAEMAEMEEA